MDERVSSTLAPGDNPGAKRRVSKRLTQEIIVVIASVVLFVVFR